MSIVWGVARAGASLLRMQLAWPARLAGCADAVCAQGLATPAHQLSPAGGRNNVTVPPCPRAVLCCAVDEHKRPVDIPFELQPASEAECLRHRLAVQKRAERLALRDRMRQRKKVRYSLDGQERARWAAPLCCCRSGVSKG